MPRHREDLLGTEILVEASVPASRAVSEQTTVKTAPARDAARTCPRIQVDTFAAAVPCVVVGAQGLTNVWLPTCLDRERLCRLQGPPCEDEREWAGLRSMKDRCRRSMRTVTG